MNRRILVSLVLVGAFLYWFYLLYSYRADRSIEGLAAPPFSLLDEEGHVVQLADYKGRVVLLHFWATWCPPCLEEIPSLDKLDKRLKDQSFSLLAVSMDEGGARAVDQFRARVPFALKILFDPEMKAAEVFKTFKLPETFLINKEGIVVKKIVGPQNWESPIWEELIKEIL